MAEPLLIAPSIAETDPAELAALPEKTAREFMWYMYEQSYKTYKEIEAAVERSALVELTADDNLALVGRMRNPNWRASFSPYLLPHSAVALRAIGRLWRRELNDSTMIDARLSVTSLVRSEDRQDQLVESGKLASRDSTHQVGAAFDIDRSGYYMINESGVYVPVIDPDRSESGRAKTTSYLQAHDPTSAYETPKGDYVYDRRVTEALFRVATRLHEMNAINLIPEFDGPNRCLHIAPHPWVLPA